jgi:CubicO group peptidase (beta-lactamase class C family)
MENRALIDDVLLDFRKAHDVPGIVAGIIDGAATTIRSSGFANIGAERPVTDRTLYRIASMTKSFTALAVLRLRDEGVLCLDDAASAYTAKAMGASNPAQ